MEKLKIIVTGASSGIGKEAVRLFLNEGHSVAALARSKEKMESLKEEFTDLPGKLFCIPCDVRDDLGVKGATQKSAEEFGGIDVLVNNAGYSENGEFEVMPVSRYEANMDTNFYGVIRCSQAVLPHLKKSNNAHIINISSIVGKVSFPFQSSYCATKFALEALSQTMRIELSQYGIHVSVLNPGYTDTNFLNASQGGRIDTPNWMKGQSPQFVAKKIEKLIQSPKRNLCLTFVGKMAIFMNRWSQGFFENFIKKEYLRQKKST